MIKENKGTKITSYHFFLSMLISVSIYIYICIWEEIFTDSLYLKIDNLRIKFILKKLTKISLIIIILHSWFRNIV